MSASVDIQGIDDVIALIRMIETAIEASLMPVGLEVQNRIAPYPRASHARQAFKTTNQRRAFFAKLRKGQITVPYQRTGDTLGRWVPSKSGKTAVVIQNTSPHAKWVHSAQQQAGYHKGNWKTDKEVAEQIVNDGTAGGIIEQALQQLFGSG